MSAAERRWGRPSGEYEVRHGDVVIGLLAEVEVDQPWFRGRFEPGEGWAGLSALFAAQEDARRRGFPEDSVEAVRAVRALDLDLVPGNGEEIIKPWMIYLAEGQGSFRY